MARALERILFRRDSSVHGMARVSAVPATYLPGLVIHKEIRKKLSRTREMEIHFSDFGGGFLEESSGMFGIAWPRIQEWQ